MSSSPAVGPGAPAGQPNHLRRFLTLWLGSSIVALPLVIIFIGPLLGPAGGNSAETSGEITDMKVLVGVATPIILLVMTFLLYAMINFRQEQGSVLEGPAVRGDARVQSLWIVITSVLVLAIAVFGTVRLESESGDGSGSGPKPLTSPSGPKIPVQVIAQQWLFTYRYPTYGGVETTSLVLPVNKEIEFNVTSLDVIHSFWAFQIGVKADANPGVDNIAFSKPTREMEFEVHCAELCGIWHGAMHNEARVVSDTAFESWIGEQRARLAPATKVLPGYSRTYTPEPLRRAE